jgi:hypothetical protein
LLGAQAVNPNISLHNNYIPFSVSWPRLLSGREISYDKIAGKNSRGEVYGLRPWPEGIFHRVAEKWQEPKMYRSHNANHRGGVPFVFWDGGKRFQC